MYNSTPSGTSGSKMTYESQQWERGRDSRHNESRQGTVSKGATPVNHDLVQWDYSSHEAGSSWQRVRNFFSTEKHRKAIEELEQEHRTTLRVQERWYTEEFHRLRDIHQEELLTKDSLFNSQHDYFNQKLNDANSTYAVMEIRLKKEIDQGRVQFFNEQKRAKTELETEQVRHHDEVNRLVQDQKIKEQEMIRKFNDALKLRVDEVSKLNSVLMTKDTEAFVAPLLGFPEAKEEPDEHIKNYFSELAQLVDTLSRLEWRQNQPVWTESLLVQMNQSTSPRILKKHILKDMIWGMLNRHIFCSPFRVFGREGLILEKQWNDRFGADPRFNNGLYSWPEPSITAERWRYFTIRECRQILTESLSEYDSRAKIKAAFMTTVRSLISDIEGMLMEMVHESDINIQTIEQLAKKMALRWLEFSMYRCRIVISMQGSSHSTAADKARMAQEGSLSLTIVPSLKRHGNVKGTDLDKDSVLRGCAGESFSLP